MHPASAFRSVDPSALAAFIADRGLALIVGVSREGRPLAAHAPVLLDGKTLRFHLSAGNALVPVFAAGRRALAVVTGPDAYVSPDWYAAADQVPTWNYVSAEIEGPVQALDMVSTTSLLDDLSSHFEARLEPKPPWTRGKMTPGRFEAMLGAIVGFEMNVERLEGIRKLSQNKSADEAARVAAALAQRHDDPGAVAIARLMQS